MSADDPVGSQTTLVRGLDLALHLIEQDLCWRPTVASGDWSPRRLIAVAALGSIDALKRERMERLRPEDTSL